MKVSFNWLKEYIDIEESPEVLAESLTRAGISVEYLINPGEGIVDVVTGLVTDIVRHPEADKLWICQIDIKAGELVQIVTGADNVTKGAIVPVAQVGSILPDGRTMKKAKLRGVDSAGMLCSASELAIDDKLLQANERNGIFILPADTAVGVDVKTVLGLDDVIFDIELTANRGDCMSIVGIAREVAAITGKTLKMPDTKVKEEGTSPAESIKVEIKDEQLCQRFCARTLTDIKMQPSPMWMQNRLRACDMRPISNVVDVTNYVMLEMGQPMHAYDSETISGNTVIARSAVDGEILVTLDDIKRNLTSGMTVIADKDNAIGLGGVMGGLHTEISDKTKYVLLEAACFAPVTTRKTARTLSLRSEASSRFEHGIDRENIVNALDRAAKLLEDIGACKVCPGRIDNYPVKHQELVINTSQEAINRRLGTDIAQDKMVDILRKLGFIVAVNGEQLAIKVPSWRNDVKVAADVSEEIARINGFDSIAGTVPVSGMMQGKQSNLGKLCDNVRSCLSAAGLNEVINYTFNFNDALKDKLNLASDCDLRKAIPVLNPITDEFKLMRTTLVGGLLNTVEYNNANRNDDVAIFEVGSVYLADQLPLKDFPVEEVWLSAALTGKRYSPDWNQVKQDADFYDVKGLVEELFEKLNITDYQFKKDSTRYLHPGKSAVIVYKGEIIGYLGEVHPKVANSFNLNKATYILELKLQPLMDDACKLAKYQKLPKFPEMYRDLSMLAPVNVSHEQLVGAIEKSGGKLLKTVRLFDLYTGKQIEEGFKSMAYALSFQADDRTLTDQEVDKAIKAIVECLETEFSVKLRG